METKTVWLVMYHNGYDSWDVAKVCATKQIAIREEHQLSKDDPMTNFGIFEYDLEME